MGGWRSLLTSHRCNDQSPRGYVCLDHDAYYSARLQETKEIEPIAGDGLVRRQARVATGDLNSTQSRLSMLQFANMLKVGKHRAQPSMTSAKRVCRLLNDSQSCKSILCYSHFELCSRVYKGQSTGRPFQILMARALDGSNKLGFATGRSADVARLLGGEPKEGHGKH